MDAWLRMTRSALATIMPWSAARSLKAGDMSEISGELLRGSMAISVQAKAVPVLILTDKMPDSRAFAQIHQVFMVLHDCAWIAF